jgi:hypothetical protein
VDLTGGNDHGRIARSGRERTRDEIPSVEREPTTFIEVATFVWGVEVEPDGTDAPRDEEAHWANLDRIELDAEPVLTWVDRLPAELDSRSPDEHTSRATLGPMKPSEELLSARLDRTKLHDHEARPGPVTASPRDEKPKRGVRALFPREEEHLARAALTGVDDDRRLARLGLENVREVAPVAELERTSLDEVATLASGVKADGKRPSHEPARPPDGALARDGEPT